ncbi:hypothetical protein APHACPA_1447 [Rickettsia amblyommatis str. Ac/Pa]|uniref:Uncharacterized protein n=1 Tax=Rickettsia amblyommatis str. Ac/Pa TaxID=1359164 RepID=A0A0F3N2V2_RICAM|nr:hypothetical protein APHACPA_1447 [Rickettsia amblyommatis str. Ac/Pa]
MNNKRAIIITNSDKKFISYLYTYNKEPYIRFCQKITFMSKKKKLGLESCSFF